MKKKKLLLCFEIMKNFGKLFSGEVWKTARVIGFYRGFAFLRIIFWAFLVGAIRDVVSFILIPDYPPDPEYKNIDGVITNLKETG